MPHRRRGRARSILGSGVGRDIGTHEARAVGGGHAGQSREIVAARRRARREPPFGARRWTGAGRRASTRERIGALCCGSSNRASALYRAEGISGARRGESHRQRVGPRPLWRQYHPPYPFLHDLWAGPARTADEPRNRLDRPLRRTASPAGAMTQPPHILVVEAPYYDHIAAELRRGAERALAVAAATHESLQDPGAFEVHAAVV